MVHLYIFDCFGYYRYNIEGLSSGELILFTIMSFILITILLSYYKRISKTVNYKNTQIENPIYSSKDVFSQEIVGDSNFVLTEKSTSIITKVIIYTLITILITSSMFKLLTNGVLEYMN